MTIPNPNCRLAIRSARRASTSSGFQPVTNYWPSLNGEGCIRRVQSAFTRRLALSTWPQFQNSSFTLFSDQCNIWLCIENKVMRSLGLKSRSTFNDSSPHTSLFGSRNACFCNICLCLVSNTFVTMELIEYNGIWVWVKLK